MVEWARIFLPALLQAGRKDGAAHEPPPATPNFSKPLTDPYTLAANPNKPKGRQIPLTLPMWCSNRRNCDDSGNFASHLLTHCDDSPNQHTHHSTHESFALCKLTPLSILIPSFPGAAPPASATNSAATLQNSWAQDFPQVLLGLMHYPFTTGSCCWTQLLQDLHLL